VVEAILVGLTTAAVVVAAVLIARNRRLANDRTKLSRRLDDAERKARRRAEVDRSARARLEMALDAIPQGMLILDRDGHTTYTNAIATAFETARHGDALVAAAIEEVVADAVIGQTEVRTVELFGPPKRTLVITASPLFGVEEPDRLVGAMVIIDDVSERRRVDDMRRDFISNISHELKTPVGAISLLAETLLEEDDLDVTQRLADRIVVEVTRVSRSIDDLLELSRIETEHRSIEETVAVADVVADAVSRIRPAAEQADIDIRVNSVDTWLAVVGDRRQITSALSNLLDNAVKYSDAGSSVEIGAGLEDGMAAISVRDHGIGIPARDVERIFERFYRVDQARSRRTGGTGLGLAIVRHVAHNHDGDVTVESRLGEGSVFTLLLPAAPPLEAAGDLRSQSPLTTPSSVDGARKAG
jgi:two-component system sensor histidine kinase SenX3